MSLPGYYIGKWTQVIKPHPTPMERPELYFERHLLRRNPLGPVPIAHVNFELGLWTWWFKGPVSKEWDIECGHTKNPLKAFLLADFKMIRAWPYIVEDADYYEVISVIARANQERDQTV